MRIGVDMKPYLGSEKYAENLADLEYRNFITEQYKFFASNRPRHMPKPEIYLWEKFFKIDFNTRPLDPRKRWFELGKKVNVPVDERIANSFSR
jgi:small subunit ribosomal protein S30